MDETQPWGKTNLPSMSWGEEEQTVRGHMSSPSHRGEEEGFGLKVVWPQCISGHLFKQGQLSCLVWSCQGGTPRTAKGDAQLLLKYQSKGLHRAFQGAFHRKKQWGWCSKFHALPPARWSRKGAVCWHTLCMGKGKKGKSKPAKEHHNVQGSTHKYYFILWPNCKQDSLDFLQNLRLSWVEYQSQHSLSLFL